MIIAAHYGNVEDIEIFWTLIALVGLVFAIFNLREATQDKKAIKALKETNGRIKIAKASFKSEIARVIKQAIFLVIGVLAMTLPGVEYTGLPWSQILINVTIRWGLITASFLTTYQSYLVYRLRRELNP
jgi:H+/Cl- antiporter ClcA